MYFQGNLKVLEEIKTDMQNLENAMLMHDKMADGSHTNANSAGTKSKKDVSSQDFIPNESLIIPDFILVKTIS